jgi:hypothetical protein
MLASMLARLVPAAVALALLAPGHALAKKKEKKPVNYSSESFTPMGMIIEFMPAASLCMPTAAVACKSRWGTTAPSFGGQFTLGYRPVRHIAIGIAYVGSTLRLDWNVVDSMAEPLNRKFEGLAQIHGGYMFARPTYSYHRLDVAVEVGGGFSYTKFPGSADNGFTGMYARGFSLLMAPTVDVFLARKVYMGVKVDFIMNIQSKVCVEDDNGKTCRARNKDDDQLPIHQILPGIHLGFVL